MTVFIHYLPAPGALALTQSFEQSWSAGSKCNRFLHTLGTSPPGSSLDALECNHHSVTSLRAS